MTLSPETDAKLIEQADRAWLTWFPANERGHHEFKKWFKGQLQAAAVVAVEGMETKLEIVENERDAFQCRCSEMEAARLQERHSLCTQIEEARDEIKQLRASLKMVPMFPPVYEKTTTDEVAGILKCWDESGRHWGESCLMAVAAFIDQQLIAKRIQRPLLPTGGGMTVDAFMAKVEHELREGYKRSDMSKFLAQVRIAYEQAISESVAAAEKAKDEHWNAVGYRELAAAEQRHAAELATLKKTHEEEMESISADAQAASDECERLRAELAQQREAEIALRGILAKKEAEWQHWRTEWQEAAREADAVVAQERSNWLDLKKRMCEAAAEQKREAVAAAYEHAARRMFAKRDEAVLAQDFDKAAMFRQLARGFRLDAERAAKPQEPEKPAITIVPAPESLLRAGEKLMAERRIEEAVKAAKATSTKPQEEGPKCNDCGGDINGPCWCPRPKKEEDEGPKMCGAKNCTCDLPASQAAQEEKTPFDWPDEPGPVPGTFERNCAWWLI